ncbi:MAG: NAD(P)-binding protein [Desulfuromonadaceae bacterium]|nr:NAD(P)-binding protein [Desulfuromonadaceae bacterium]
MKNQSEVSGKKKVAVIGGGVAGIVAAHRLQASHQVTLFEAADYLGGHTHTILVPEGPDAGTPVDTGFIVFNEATYPNFIGFLDELGVPSREAEMSFGFHCRRSGLIYAGNDLNGLFAQRRNLFDPRFYHFLIEIGRFCRQALADLKTDEDLGTLEDYVLQHRFLPFMVDNYLRPMAAAIWSTPAGQVAIFPTRPFLNFFKNHGLLSFRNRPRWRTVVGGSSSYVKAFAGCFTGTIRLGTPVGKVCRGADGIRLEFHGEGPEHFDQVVIATHADQALLLLGDPTPEETKLLSPWRYLANDTVLHTDLSVLPPLPRAWCCWNFTRESGPEATQPVYVTYSMNLLQGLKTKNHYLVTLNHTGDFDESRVIARMVYHHPTYTSDSMETQPFLADLNSQGNDTFFCGSYFGYGFHEDAVRSSLRMVSQLRGKG